MNRASTPHEGPSTHLGSYSALLGLGLASLILLVALFSSNWERERILPRGLDETITSPPRVSLGSAGYVGEAACAPCHPGEAATHSGSGHHRTLRHAGEGAFARSLDGKRFNDPEMPGVEWSYRRVGEKLEVERRAEGKSERMVLDFAVGSGKHGLSYVKVEPTTNSATGPAGLEHRFSYFGPSGKLEITPGQEIADAKRFKLELVGFGRELKPDRLRKCIACHATLTSVANPDLFDPATVVPNVSCERCHGPGRDHIEAVQSGRTDDLKMPMNLLTDPMYQVEQCGECHRLVNSVDRAALRPDNPQIVRFQPLGLQLSACFKGGQGTLTCSSCHDAHARVSLDTAAYEAVCLKCHEASSPNRPCPVSPAGKCVGCHMPRREVPGGFQFTDHWIRKPGAGPEAAQDPSRLDPKRIPMH